MKNRGDFVAVIPFWFGTVKKIDTLKLKEALSNG